MAKAANVTANRTIASPTPPARIFVVDSNILIIACNPAGLAAHLRMQHYSRIKRPPTRTVRHNGPAIAYVPHLARYHFHLTHFVQSTHQTAPSTTLEPTPEATTTGHPSLSNEPLRPDTPTRIIAYTRSPDRSQRSLHVPRVPRTRPRVGPKGLSDAEDGVEVILRLRARTAVRAHDSRAEPARPRRCERAHDLSPMRAR